MGNIKDIGSSIFGAVTDIVGGVGTNFAATADTNEAMAQRLQVENQLALSGAVAANKRAEENQRLIKNAVYFILIVVAFISVVSMLPKITKAFNNA